MLLVILLHRRHRPQKPALRGAVFRILATASTRPVATAFSSTPLGGAATSIGSFATPLTSATGTSTTATAGVPTASAPALLSVLRGCPAEQGHAQLRAGRADGAGVGR